MIIQCEQCRTKFKLDDSRVTERGVRVRCAKCRHVFTVRRADAAPQASDETVVMAAPVSEAASIAAQTDAGFAHEPAAPAAESPSFDLGEVSFADISVDSQPAAPAAGFDDEKTMVMPPSQKSAAATEIDFGTVLPQAADASPTPSIQFDFGEARPTAAQPQAINFDFTSKPTAVVAAPAGDIDFGGFDFGDVSVAKPDDSFALTGADFGAVSPSGSATGSEVGDLGFAFDDVAPQTVTEPADGFDFANLDFGTGQPVAAPAAESEGLGELDFSADTAPVAVAAPDKDATLFAFSPAEPSQPATLTAAQPEATAAPSPASAFTFESSTADEAPPLSIASRRRQSPVLSVLFAVVALVVVAGLGYVGYQFIGSGTKAATLFGKGVPVDEGRITVQKVQAAFLTKAAAGDLLIITGELHNGYSKPRAALQVKATVFGPNNEPLATQTAYAGNQLTREQLATMSKEKIEAAMNNQFGDSLANLEVAPGKTIPFTLVMINPPANGKEYGVEAAGSTVAASK